MSWTRLSVLFYFETFELVLAGPGLDDDGVTLARDAIDAQMVRTRRIAVVPDWLPALAESHLSVTGH